MAKKVAAAGPVEGRWALPEGWRWERAKDIARIVGGSTPKNAADPANYSDDGTPWLTPADLSGYSKATIGRGRRNLAAHVVNRPALLPAGAVLISSRAPVGYCAVAANPMVTNQGFRSLILKDGIDPFFIRYYVLFSRKYLEDHASGTTFKELSGGALGDLVFPVPSLDVQRGIVERIDQLFAEVEEGESLLSSCWVGIDSQKLLGLAATLRQSILAAAFCGKLT
jgi:type I restriction enzyme S subunit